MDSYGSKVGAPRRNESIMSLQGDFLGGAIFDECITLLTEELKSFVAASISLDLQ